MTFTNDDLKRLKEMDKPFSCGCTMCHLHYGHMREQMQAFLARLEATEKVLSILEKEEDLQTMNWFLPARKAYLYWRQLAGK